MDNKLAAAESASPKAASPSRPRWYQFSLRTLLLLMLLVAVYLAGRSSWNFHSPFGPRLEGSWQMKLPAGWVQPTTIHRLRDGTFQIASRADNLSGIYEWRDGQLVVMKPADDRMTGLAWQWDGTQLLLVGEPAGSPAGSSYMGAVLTRAPAK
jgi:hypothetical protein